MLIADQVAIAPCTDPIQVQLVTCGNPLCAFVVCLLGSDQDRENPLVAITIPICFNCSELEINNVLQLPHVFVKILSGILLMSFVNEKSPGNVRQRIEPAEVSANREV